MVKKLLNVINFVMSEFKIASYLAFFTIDHSFVRSFHQNDGVASPPHFCKIVIY